MTIRCFAAAAMVVCTATVPAAQHATTTAPGAYRTQFENDYIRVVRVHYGPNEKVPEHEHTPANTVYIYLNASGPVQFRHIKGATHIANRQPTVAGSFRVSRGGDETHEAINMSATPSEFMRLEFKTDSAGESPFFRESASRDPGAENIVTVKFTNKQMRITRLAIAPAKTLDLSAARTDPALIVALKNSTLSGFNAGPPAAIAAGQERWMNAGDQLRLANTGTAPAELLRVDFLTGPRK